MSNLKSDVELAITMLRTGMPEYDARDVLEVLTRALEQQPAGEPVAWHDKIMGMEVSMDVSTGDDDAQHRIFGRVYEVMLKECGSDEYVICAIEDGRNFDTRPQPAAPAIPEGYALIGIDALKAWGKYDEVAAACRYPLAAAPEQPADEPVATIGMIDEDHFVDVCRKAKGNSNTPLYTRPQRAAQWVALTSDEAHTIVGNVANIGDALRIVRDTQAKLREKNGGKA